MEGKNEDIGIKSYFYYDKIQYYFLLSHIT